MSFDIICAHMQERAEISQKTRYFQKLSLSHLTQMRILRDGDLLETKSKLAELGANGIWRNVSEHCIAQAAGCVALAELLNLPEESKKKLVEAGLIHDSDKKYSATGLKQFNMEVEKGVLTEEEADAKKFEFYEQSEKHNAQNLRNKGISEDIIKLVVADGHTALPNMISDKATMEEKVFHYIGSITRDNDITPLDDRIDKLEADPKYFRMNEYGKQVSWTKGKTFYNVQREVGHQIELDLAKRVIREHNLPYRFVWMLQENPKNLPKVIKGYLFDVIIPRETAKIN